MPLAFLRSSSTFLSFVSGQFGQGLIDDYLATLKDFPHLGIPAVAQTFFQLAIQAMAENWRRFTLPTMSFPYTMFRLLDCELDQFREEFERLKAKKDMCCQCADLEFSTPLLSWINVSTPEAAQRSMHAVQRFLRHMSLQAPISSDLVECLHGWTQHLLHRWRGVKPSDAVAQERAMFTLITRSFGRFKKWMWERHGDQKSGYRLYRYGKASCNQYSQEKRGNADGDMAIVAQKDAGEAKRPKPKPSTRAPLSVEKMNTLLAFEQEDSLRMPRKVCGSLVQFSLATFLRKLEHTKSNRLTGTGSLGVKLSSYIYKYYIIKKYRNILKHNY